MKYDNQLRYASSIVKQYDGQVPLAAWLKDFFRANKQMGSRDRKTVSEMVYGYYRLGANQYESVEERILAFVNISPLLKEERDYFFGQKAKEPPQIDPHNLFSFGKHLITLCYSIYNGISLFPTRMQEASKRANDAVVELANVLEGKLMSIDMRRF